MRRISYIEKIYSNKGKVFKLTLIERSCTLYTLGFLSVSEQKCMFILFGVDICNYIYLKIYI